MVCYFYDETFVHTYMIYLFKYMQGIHTGIILINVCMYVLIACM